MPAVDTIPDPLVIDPYEFTNVIFIGFTILGASLLMLLFVWLGWRASFRRPPQSPYSHAPLRKATELPYATIGKIYLFMTGLHQYDNRMFNIRRAAFCRETNRVFSDFVTFTGRIRWDWSFLHRRYPGTWVSWGSLTLEQQKEIRRVHPTLAGFQTKISSPYPSPRQITAEFSHIGPGPLYVDLETQELLGWKVVPGTEVEVLVVQKPRKFKSLRKA